MTAGVLPVAKKKPEPQPADTDIDRGAEEWDKSIPKATLKVPARFYERLERIKNRVNAIRRSRGEGTIPVGWFVVHYLTDWIAEAEARLGLPPVPPDSK
jgi:hypothetical protein